MATAKAFARNMRNRGRSVGQNVNALVRRVALTADRDLVLGTPVDTGRAKSNWVVEIGAPSAGEIEAYSSGMGGSTASTNEQAALTQAAVAVSARQLGQAIYITNNLPYIQRLNEGSSAQAPAGFVETAVSNARRMANRGRLLDKR